MVDAQRLERGARATVEGAPIDKAEALGIVAAEKHVLGDTEARNDVELLMDEAEAEAMSLAGLRMIAGWSPTKSRRRQGLPRRRGS